MNIHEMAKMGDLESLIHLKYRGIPIFFNMPRSFKTACKHGHIGTTYYLLLHGARVHDFNDYALKESARLGNMKMVRLLVENGVTIDSYACDCAIGLASENGHIEIVQYLVNVYSSYVYFMYGHVLTIPNIITKYHNGPFRRAAANGYIHMVEWLIANGADLHDHNEDAIKLAAKNGHVQMVRFLVKRGADLHVDHDCPLRNAAEHGHVEVVEYLIQNGAKTNEYYECALRLASGNGHLQVVEQLVENGADIHVQKDEAFRLAVMSGHLSVVRYLVKNGAYIHILKDTAMKVAIGRRYTEIVRLLASRDPEYYNTFPLYMVFIKKCGIR